MTRELAKENFKKIIDSIREKPVVWTDLKDETKLPDKTLSRSLEYLQYWGLVKKDENGFWNWHEKVVTYNSETEYNLAIRHSKNLDKGLSGLEASALLRYTEPDTWSYQTRPWKSPEISAMASMVGEHIKTAYPELSKLLEDFAKINRERYDLLVELRQTASKLGFKNVEKPHSEFDLLKNLANWMSYLNNKKVKPKTEPDDMILWIVPKEYRKNIAMFAEQIPLEKLKQIEAIERGIRDLFLSISDEIKKLQMQILNGLPLKGKCQLCPNIKIRDVESSSDKNSERHAEKKGIFLAKDFDNKLKSI